MKKNLFEIKTEEVQRILSLHEERTKSQYLNIMEQVAAAPYIQYITSKENCLKDNRCVPPKTTFVPYNEKVAIAYGVKLNSQESPVNVKFYCKSPDYRFGISYPSGEMVVYNDLLKSTLLKTVCGHPKNTSAKPVVKPKTTVKSPEVTQPATSGLTADQQLERALLCGHSSWEEYKNSKWACAKQLDAVTISSKKQQNQQLANTKQQFTQKTVAGINNVQKTLGVQQTGQLTTKDIDALLAKLK